MSKEGRFDMQIETVYYLVEFRQYDLRQTVHIFTTVAFRLCKSSLQLHFRVFQSFYFGYKGVRVFGVRVFGSAFFQMWGYWLYFLKPGVKFIIKVKTRVHGCNFSNLLDTLYSPLISHLCSTWLSSIICFGIIYG